MDEEMETSSALATMEVEKPRKLVIFAWSGDLDRVWPQLILATTGAAMGMETTVFFTFWGLFPLLKNDRKHGRKRRLTGENWMQKLLSSMNHGGTEHLKLGKMNFRCSVPPWFMDDSSFCIQFSPVSRRFRPCFRSFFSSGN